MKRFSILLFCALLIIASLAFVSCDQQSVDDTLNNLMEQSAGIFEPVFKKTESSLENGENNDEGSSNENEENENASGGNGESNDEENSNASTNVSVEIHFIDVGQGDATLIKVGDKNILVDTGEKSAKDELLAYLNNQSVSEIEYFVVTHFDTDHFGNGIDVLENYDVKNLLIPEQVKTTVSYENFIDKATEQAESNDIEVFNANEMIGEKLLVNELELTILAPLKNDYDDSNNYSIVLMACYGSKRVLLSGDAEKEAEEDIVSTYSSNELDCDIFKLGHHGSRTSSSQELLDLATPEYVVVSCGEDNQYGHPHSEVLERVEGIALYRTDTQGTIVFIISNNIISVTTEK